MNGKLTIGTIVMAGAAWLASTAPSVAAPVVVFQDNFEDTTPPLPHLVDNPQVGSYPTVAPTIPESSVYAAGGSYPASPGDGANILRIFGKQRNYAVLSSPASGEGTLTFEFDARLDASSAFSFGLIGDTGVVSLDGLKNPIWIQLTTTALQAYSLPGSWQTVAGLSHTMSTWQHYKIVYELGSSQFDLTAGANTATSTRLNQATAINEVTHVFVNGGTDAHLAYVDNVVVTFDAVPEPAGLALLGLGLPLLLSRRRR